MAVLNEIVREVLYDWSPVELTFLRPSDEYDTEIRLLVDAANQTTSAVELAHAIHHIFTDQFHEQFNKHYAECLLIAKKILWRSGEKQGFHVVVIAKLSFFPDKINNREQITGFTTPAHFVGEDSAWSMIVVFKEPVNESFNALAECTFLMENAPAKLLFRGNRFQFVRSGPFCEAEVIESDMPIIKARHQMSPTIQDHWIDDDPWEVVRTRRKIIRRSIIALGFNILVILIVMVIAVWWLNSFFKSLCGAASC